MQYVQVLSKWGPSQLEIVLELLKYKVCPRCCLRFSGVGPSKEIYSQSAPSACQLKEAILKELKKDPEKASDVDDKVEICPLCLGALQSMDGTTDHTDAKKAFLCDPLDKSWTNLSGIQKDVIFTLLKEKQVEFDSCEVVVELAGWIAFREKCLWTCLLKQKQLNMKGLRYDQLTDIREVLKNVIGGWITKDLGKKILGRDKADVHFTICVSQYGGYSELVPLYKFYKKHCVQERNKKNFGKRKADSATPQGGSLSFPSSPSWVNYTLADRMMAELQKTMQQHCMIFDQVPQPPDSPAYIGFKIRKEAYYLGGRYLKLQRGIPQSPLFFQGAGKQYPVTVSTIIGKVVQDKCDATGFVFTGAGREDIDVRMLGAGRPFVMLVQNPGQRITQKDIRAIEEQINQNEQVQVRNLKFFTEERVKQIKECEEHKEKTYGALCWMARPITDDDVNLLQAKRDLVIMQETPIRVVHTRANATRQKCVHEMKVRKVEGAGGHYFQIAMKTQAGTYVKEFVNGNFGRTQPSLASLLGCRVEIQQLDVLDINFDI